MLLLQYLLQQFFPNCLATLAIVELNFFYFIHMAVVYYLQVLRLFWIFGCYLCEQSISDFLTRNGALDFLLLGLASYFVFRTMLKELGYELRFGTKRDDVLL
ncbi:unnamed protein product, partial [Mesorhabditis spiculigera]